MYCTQDKDLLALYYPVCDIGVSRLYLMRDQTYSGRCCVAYRAHISELYQLPDEELVQYTTDIKRVMGAMAKIFSPDKINVGSFYDLGRHLHFHLVPKYSGGPDYGSMFIMTTEPHLYFPEEEYAAIAERIKAAL
jgi:diadenosine tetraphosphate (Ap4A) HIT family hydrolase